MPLFETRANARGRIRVFARAQLPFFFAVLFVIGVVGLAEPSTLSFGVVTAGLLLTVIATLAALLVPWERLPLPWIMSVAILDLLAVALLRAALLPFVPAVAILAIFPVLWLSYRFRWYGMVVAVFGAVFITSFRFVYAGAWPATALEWANVFVLPTVIVGVAVVVFLAASNLRLKSLHLSQANRAQADALAEARDAESLALGIVNTVSAGVAFYDAAGRLRVANSRAHRFAELGGFRLDAQPYAGEEVLRTDRTSTVPHDDQVIPRALAGETVSDQFQWWGPAESQVAVLASSSRVRRSEGDILGTVIVIHDVTELAEAIEVREQFLRTVSHELRTPLTSVTGFLELIEDAIAPGDDKLRQYIDIATRRADDLARRFRDLFAAGESEKTVQRDAVDLDDLVRTAVDAVAALAATHGHTIETVSAPSPPAFVDRSQLLVAVTELLTNAVKYGIPCAPITLASGVHDGRAQISVTDGGPGLDKAEQRRAFDRFYRGSSARSRQIQGFGLGLTTVRAIAVAHGGTVRIDSVPGARTTVALDLPAHLPDAAEHTLGT